jgi:hypothetical protein
VINNMCDSSNNNRAQELACELRNSDIWDNDKLAELCDIAGIKDDFYTAKGREVEDVVDEASKILGVEIYTYI